MALQRADLATPQGRGLDRSLLRLFAERVPRHAACPFIRRGRRQRSDPVAVAVSGQLCECTGLQSSIGAVFGNPPHSWKKFWVAEFTPGEDRTKNERSVLRFDGIPQGRHRDGRVSAFQKRRRASDDRVIISPKGFDDDWNGLLCRL